MKAAVSILQPHLEKIEGQSKGKLVIATVRGDVHDIGKNLVDIILSNNGYEVINLGIKQTIEAILAAYEKSQADAIGMSGLLVKSTAVMKENLEIMNQLGFSLPVILGGAALTRNYVENELRKIYRGQVFYAKDAFEGLSLMNQITTGKLVESSMIETENEAEESTAPIFKKSDKAEAIYPVKPPTPPFWGRRIVRGIPVSEVIPFLNKKALFLSRWQGKAKSQQRADFEKFKIDVLEPTFDKIVDKAMRRQLINPMVVYGYYPCNAEGNNLHVYESLSSEQSIIKFTFARQSIENGICVADYFMPKSSGKKDVVAFHVVTAGSEASKEAQQLFEKNEYQNYLYWHGFSVEFAEALAEYWHKQIRRELGIAGEDAAEIKKLFTCHYHGCRYSFGYPACPNLEDQVKLFQLLKPEEIGVSLTEELQMVPEQSTSAIIVHHPQAKYFGV
jgi:5-methyltetrahydrofolate--homocysteine methyltransferase